ncbi:MAG: aminotransferase class V-fold PLP-dependent enzyme [Gammaproteobacteria bacterium]|nr:aminotransferase class V-fold PLP-dependent enzyme [Gammaproteobacteria bacterium]
MKKTLDIERIRADTPGLAHVTHLIASGAALMPQPVIDAVINHLQLEAMIGGYEASAQQAEKLDNVYPLVASLIGAKANEIAILENATAAWCQAFYALSFKPGQRILTCMAEYAANYVAFLQRAKRDGVAIEVIPNAADGALDVDALESMIDDKVALIAITWIPTNGGLVNPAAAVGQLARRHGIPYLLDACQAVGQMPVDVDALHCDFLSATGRKFLRAPRGTGFLYVRETWLNKLEPAMIDHFAAPWVARDRYELRNDARRFENWENAYALRAGLAAAVEYALDIGLDSIRERAWGLADELRQMLSDLPGTKLYDAGSEQSAIVSFTVEGLEAREVVTRLRGQGINIGASDPSSTRLDAEDRQLPVLLRAAPHYYNTTAELQILLDALQSLRPA